MTLNKTWIECLKMWEWISAVVKVAGGYFDVENLKETWLENNGYEEGLRNDCFFCEYDYSRKGDCSTCPGYLVDKTFDCLFTRYSFDGNPVAFYKKLVSLNKKRLRGKKNG